MVKILQVSLSATIPFAQQDRKGERKFLVPSGFSLLHRTVYKKRVPEKCERTSYFE